MKDDTIISAKKKNAPLWPYTSIVEYGALMAKQQLTINQKIGEIYRQEPKKPKNGREKRFYVF